MRVLLVKMSSLGDVVHTLPAVTDAAAHGVRFDWVVEEAFSAIPARHPAVATVIPVAWRRWRQALWTHRAAACGFVRRLRRERYDGILDAQGLIKSAVVTRLARAPWRSGLDRASAREGLAALAYRHPVAVPAGLHAIERLRRLFAAALDYPPPAADAPLDYGLPQVASPLRRCVLLHGSTWPSKHWPEPFWHALAGLARAAGFTVAVPAGSPVERQRAERIAAAGAGSVWAGRSLAELDTLIGASALAIGVDSGLTHLAAALAVPTLALYGSTDSALTGCRGPQVRNLQAEFPCAPCRSRQCRYQGEPQFWQNEPVLPACFAMLPPERVWQAALALLPSRPESRVDSAHRGDSDGS
jgi:heptosyltransferase-1